MDSLMNVLTSIGVIWIVLFGTQLLRFIYIYSRSSSLPRYHYSHQGKAPWAIVTGASDGIGKEYTRELARRGFNVILHGRNVTKLDVVKSELSAEFADVSFRTIIADASKGGSDRNKQLEAIGDSLKDLHITILVNNVGSAVRLMGPTYSTFDKDKPDDIDGLINVNACFPAQFTSTILPLLMAHGGPSLILNMGSMADSGSPWLSIYSASKAFDMSWSRSLTREMHAEGRNIEVLGVMTGQVTNTSRAKSPASLFRPDARKYAAASLNRVGCGESVVPGYWGHALLKFITDSLPDFIFSRFVTTAVRGLMEKASKQE